MPFENILLNDGNEIPSIAYGTGSKWKWTDVTDYVEQAIECGFWHLDTAAVYETEECVGTAIRESGLARSELYITTKYARGATIQERIQASLSKLGVKQVDLYLIHNPDSFPDTPLAWKEFERIKEEGLTKSIGVSNFNVEQLQAIMKIAKVKPAVNQISFNPYNYAERKPVLDYCAKHGIIIEAYGSLAPLTTFPGGPVDAPITAAAKRLDITPTQVIFLWVRAKGAVIVTTTSTKAHMKEYLAVGDLPPLTQEEVAAIDEAAANGPPSKMLNVTKRLPTLQTRVSIMLLLGLLYLLVRAVAV